MASLQTLQTKTAAYDMQDVSEGIVRSLRHADHDMLLHALQNTPTCQPRPENVNVDELNLNAGLIDGRQNATREHARNIN